MSEPAAPLPLDAPAVGTGGGKSRTAHHECAHHLHRAGRHPAGGRQGRDERAGPLRPRLRHLHAAAAGGRHRRRGVPEATAHRPLAARDRGPLAGAGRQLLLAQRPGAQQRPLRGRHGALGHQGQAGRHAALSALRRPLPRRRAALRPRLRPRSRGGRRGRPPLHGARVPLRPLPGRRARRRHLRRCRRPRRRRRRTGAICV